MLFLLNVSSEEVSMKKRGIVISPPFEPLPSGVKCGGSPEPVDIRKYLLYWDKIDYPTNNIIHIGGNSDIDFLEKYGILKRSIIQLVGSFILDDKIFLATQQAAYEQNERDEKGCWSLAQLSNNPLFVNSLQKQCLEFELYNCLPVPECDVPLYDILQFKEKRKDELMELREYLDELYLSIIGSEDPNRALNVALDKTEKALNNIDRTLNESGINKITESLKGILSDNIDLNIAISSYFAGGHKIALGAGAFYLCRKLLSAPNFSTNDVQQPINYIKSIKTHL